MKQGPVMLCFVCIPLVYCTQHSLEDALMKEYYTVFSMYKTKGETHWRNMSTAVSLILLICLSTLQTQEPSDKHCKLSTSGPCGLCEEGWYGAYCNVTCNSNCNSYGCDKVTGRCLQCSPTFFSDNCSLSCPQNCADLQENICNRDTGNCLAGCQHGRWGKQCRKECSVNCTDRECFAPNGVCSKGCKPGAAGERCDQPCSVGCLNKVCDQWKQQCTNGCKVGYAGQKCDVKCSRNCNMASCSFSSNKSVEVCELGCIPGKMGLSCNKDCINNCSRCHQTTGECVSCVDGLWGTTCTSRCSTSCFGQLCNMQGHCLDCVAGYYGLMCNKTCADRCAVCSKYSGRCILQKEMTAEVKSKCDDCRCSALSASTLVLIIPVLIFTFIILFLLIRIKKTAKAIAKRLFDQMILFPQQEAA